jgi:hypothetical protein
VSDDLVKRLRGEDCANCVQGVCVCDIVEQAADRIEQLEAALREISQAVGDPAAYWIARVALGEKKDV